MKDILFFCVTFLLLLSGMQPAAGPIEDLKPGEWYEIPNSDQETVMPGSNQFPGTNIGFFECGMDCWCGGAFDTKRNRLLFSGGGHGSYWGNEVYAFDLDDLQWYRLNDPTLNLDGNSGGSCPVENDLYPCAIHSYDAVDYIPPAIDRYAYMDWNGKPLFLFDQENLDWEPQAVPPHYGNDERTGAVMAVDPVSGRLFYHECYTSQLMSWNPATNTWKGYGASAYLDYYYSATIDPVRRKFVATGGTGFSGQATMIWDISNLQAASIPGIRLATTGDTEIESMSNPGFEYDPVSGKLVAWGGSASVYTLDLDARVWTKVDPAPTNTVVPTTKNMNGTYGRFRYVPSRNVFILVNRSTDNVFIYKLTEGQGTGVRTTAEGTVPHITCRPNPFNSIVKIAISHQLSAISNITIGIYNAAGNLVKRLTVPPGRDRQLIAGITWNASGLPAGLYLARLTMGNKHLTKRLFLMK